MKKAKIRAEIFSREDIGHVLEGVDSANKDLAKQLPVREVRIYQAGFGAAIKAIKKAFDIKPEK